MFCRKLRLYILNEFKSGENVVEVAKNPEVDLIKEFETNNKPTESTADGEKSTIDVEIKREEIKEYVKDLKLIKSNLKKNTI